LPGAASLRQKHEKAGEREVAAAQLPPVLGEVRRLQVPGRRLERVGRLAAPDLVGAVPTHRARRRTGDTVELCRALGALPDLLPRRTVVDAAKPRFLPVEPALRLATAVRGSVEVDRVAHTATAGALDRVADLLDAARHRETAAGQAGHLRHERHAVDRAVGVERCEDLGGRPDLDDIARPQRGLVCA
jgi:hypothetical protein